MKKKMDNICGECTACCTVIGVAEFKKPMYQQCEHVCKTGCSIHKDSPKECKDYQCFYYRNPVDINLRPDKLGIVLDAQNTKMGMTLVAREVFVGASDKPEVQKFLAGLMDETNAPVYVIRPDGSRSITVPRANARAAEQLRRFQNGF